MGKNSELGLPFGKMTTVKIAFDVDGTLRCNCTATCEDPNSDIVRLFFLLERFKNTKVYVWSGSGADYAYRFSRKYGLGLSENRCISKIGAPQMDIAIDDIQDTAIGKINLIVREK